MNQRLNKSLCYFSLISPVYFNEILLQVMMVICSP